MPPSRTNNIVAGYDCEEIMEDLTMSSVLGAAEDDNNSIRYPVSSNWMQGRTTYGGFSSALLLNTARSHRDDLPPLRSALINFTAPIGSSPAVCSEILRQGRNVTTVSTKAEIDGKTVATGTFTFGRSQDSQYSIPCPPKPAKDPEQCRRFGSIRDGAPQSDDLAYEFRFLLGDLARDYATLAPADERRRLTRLVDDFA